MQTSGTLQRELKQKRAFVSVQQEATVAILRTADLARRLMNLALESSDITGQQFNVLRILRGAGPEGLPTLEIAERMIEQTPGITRLIDRLEEKKLVLRRRPSEDRRCVYCSISPGGLKLLDTLDQPVVEMGKAALASLSSKEVAQLVELLGRTRESMNQQLIERRRTS
ncbi:MAG: MarR family transcriptional regulator [Thermoanaerobaculia bacterium]